MTSTPTTTDANGGAQDAMLGVTLAGRYRLGRLLGRGGMADVYEGLHTWTERRVAVKVLRRGSGAFGSVATPEPATMERFLLEARAAAKARHERVVAVLDMGRDPATGAVFMVQEYLDGEDLRRHLQRRGRLDATEALGLLAPVLDALAAVHEAGVIHRDVKPENVFVEARAEGPFARLIDFGIARIHEDDAARSGVTRTGAVLGTAGYMSPEQARGQRDLDARTDVWSIGVVFFEALTGAAPFSGGNYNELVAQVLTQRAPRLREVAPHLAPHVADAIDRALEPDRDRRHATMRDFLTALRDEPRREVPVPAEPAQAAPDRSSRSRVWGIVAATAILAALFIATMTSFNATSSPRANTQTGTRDRLPVRHHVAPSPSAPPPTPPIVAPVAIVTAVSPLPPEAPLPRPLARHVASRPRVVRDAGTMTSPSVVPRNGALLLPP